MTSRSSHKLPHAIEAMVVSAMRAGTGCEVAEVLIHCIHRYDDASALQALHRLSHIRLPALPVLAPISHLPFGHLWHDIARDALLAGMVRTYLALVRRLPPHQRPELEFLWKWLPAGPTRCRALRGMLRIGVSPRSDRALAHHHGDGSGMSGRWIPDYIIACLTPAEWRILFRECPPSRPVVIHATPANRHGLFLPHGMIATQPEIATGQLVAAARWAPPRVMEHLLRQAAPVSSEGVTAALDRCRWRTLAHLRQAGAQMARDGWSTLIPDLWKTRPAELRRALTLLGGVSPRLRDEAHSIFDEFSAPAMRLLATHGVRPQPYALFDARGGARITQLVRMGLDPAWRSEYGDTALHHQNDPGAIRALLRHGADPLATSNQGNTAFASALDAYRLSGAKLSSITFAAPATTPPGFAQRGTMPNARASDRPRRNSPRLLRRARRSHETKIFRLATP